MGSQIADLTILTQDMLGEEELAVPMFLKMRTTSELVLFPRARDQAYAHPAMSWSHALPGVETVGKDGSLLALASKAGMIGLWA